MKILACDKKRNQQSVLSIVQGEVLKNSHSLFSFYAESDLQTTGEVMQTPFWLVLNLWLKAQRYWKADVSH